MIGEATYIACRRKQQLLPSTKQELPAWIYVRGKVQFKSMCCLEGIECEGRSYTCTEVRCGTCTLRQVCYAHFKAGVARAPEGRCGTCT
jgi:hypothetical protein